MRRTESTYTIKDAGKCVTLDVPDNISLSQVRNGDIPVVNPLLTFEGGEFATGDDGYFDDLPNYWQYVTGLPISVQLASTWNMPLLFDIGRVVGAEMVRYD